jgi:CBS domain-containing protein
MAEDLTPIPELSQEEILKFLRNTAPFDELGQKEIKHLASQAELTRYAAGSLILQRGRSKITHLALIISGKARLSLTSNDGEESVLSFREAGQAIGALGILRESLSNLDVMAVEDTVCLLLSRDDFSRLIQTNAHFSQYYLKVLSEGYVSVALTQLERTHRPLSDDSASMLLFGAQVGDVIRRRPEVIAGSESIQAAAARMIESKVGSLLVSDKGEVPVGIITDRDLRRVVARGMDHSAPVKSIMASPLRTIPSHMVCFDAMLEMIRFGMHHLVITKGMDIEGVISGHDLMLLQGSSPLRLVQEITRAQDIEELYDLALRSPRVMHALILEGAKPSNITRLITLVNDRILDRLLTMLEQQLGPPPAPYCWLFMGSEGRKEQTYSTDQDNGLLYADPMDEDHAHACKRYFKALGNEATRHLINCGYPACKGGIMASNTQWCQPLSVWKGYFERWIKAPEPQEVLHATIFFDFRPGYGAMLLGEELRDHLMNSVSGNSLFLHHLARDCLNTPKALGLFKRFVLEREGEQEGKLDLKTKGLVPFVDFARVMALKHGVGEANTLERLQAVAEQGHISTDLYQKASQAYEIQMELRLVHQDRQWEQGVEPDNFLNPDDLSELERNNLKDALAVVSEMRSFLRDEFHLDGG